MVLQVIIFEKRFQWVGECRLREPSGSQMRAEVELLIDWHPIATDHRSDAAIHQTAEH